MKYTKKERLDIGQQIYDGEIIRYQAAEIYNISEQTARDYMRLPLPPALPSPGTENDKPRKHLSAPLLMPMRIWHCAIVFIHPLFLFRNFIILLISRNRCDSI